MPSKKTVVQPQLFVETQSEQLRKQHEYTKRLEHDGFGFDLVVADAFVRGIRDIGYKSTAWALSELVDNAIQAGAANIHFIFGFPPSSSVKPDKIAIYDDGHGMEPAMIRAAVIWGGTHREGDRTGFGRYGYGLPSSCVSQGRRYTVYSRVKGGAIHAITVDLDEITKFHNGRHGFSVPTAVPSSLPTWVTDHLSEVSEGSDFEHGTVVVIENLDRVDYKKVDGLKRSMLEHFGVTYREFLASVAITVDGTAVRPVDPLFITPGMFGYDLTDVLADPYPPDAIEVRDPETKQVQAVIKVRYSYMPPKFQGDGRRGKENARFPIMKEHKGIIVCRAGRKIDVVDSKCPWFTFVNYDRNWGVEIDFPPSLDEEFSITTSKQQVVISDRMWEIFKDAGMEAAISAFKRRFNVDKKAQKIVPGGVVRPSEAVMQEKQKFEHRPGTMSAQQETRSKDNFDREVRRRAKASGISEEQVRQVLAEETKVRPYKLEFESMPGAPFFRCEQRGGQRVLFLNQSHRFFQVLYADSTPDGQAALELLLFTFSEGELDAGESLLMFYQSARQHWSERLERALNILDSLDPAEDAAMFEEELEEVEAEVA